MSSPRMRSSLPFIMAWILFVAIESCDSQKPVDRATVISEMNARELKRVSDSEIVSAAQQLGDSLTTKAHKELKSALMSALKEGGVPHAIKFCNVNALPIMQQVTNIEGLEIHRVTDRNRNPSNKVDSLENLIYEAYQYNFSNGMALEPTVIEENKEVLLYARPIQIAGGLCLNCHGTIGKEIKEDNYDTIISYYPDDQAINYQLNDLRGMWVLRIPKKSIVLSL